MSTPRPATREIGYTRIGQSGNLWWPFVQDDEETPELRWPESVKVYGRMSKDAQVLSVSSAVSLPIRSTGWYVEPNGADKEIVSFVAEDIGLPVRGMEIEPPIRTRDRFSFEEHLDVLLDFLLYGHAAFEQVYRLDESGKAHLRKLAERPQWTISDWKIANDGGLVAIEQYPLGQIQPDLIPVDRLVVYANRKRGGAWVGHSILRAAYKPWLLKDLTLRIQAQVADRNGLGVPTFIAPPVPTGIVGDAADQWIDAQIAAGKALTEGLRAGDNAGAAVANGATLESRGVVGSLPDLDKQIRYYDEQIARACLANFLSLGGENSRGSYALGETFENFFQQSLQATAQAIATTFNQHVVEDLVDINWGPGTRAPKVVCDDIGSRHPVTAQAVYQLVSCGALLPEPALEEYLRTTYGLPPKAPYTPKPSSSAATETPSNSLRRTLATLQAQLRLMDTPEPEEAE